METPIQSLEVEAPKVEILPPTKQLPEGFSVANNTHYGAPVFRDGRVKLEADKQLKLYKPCSCGSGKKFKWCCNGKQMVVIDTGS